MPTFSKISYDRLTTCHPDLQRLMQEVIKERDITIICGHRGEKEQNDAYERGVSKLRFPMSKHNSLPSMAVDIAPWPVDWENLRGFEELANHILATAEKLDIKVRWGGDWNMNGRTDDEKFRDYPHYELI